MAVTAVLDLKSAYDSAPRNKLHDTLKSKLTNNIIRMTKLAIQPVTIKTQGDKTNTVASIGKEVCQGSPLRPTLFNIYMNTYATIQCRMLSLLSIENAENITDEKLIFGKPTPDAFIKCN